MQHTRQGFVLCKLALGHIGVGTMHVCNPKRLVAQKNAQLAHRRVRLKLDHADDGIDADLLVEDEQLSEEVHLLRRRQESVRVDPGELWMQFLLLLELLVLVLLLKLTRALYLIMTKLSRGASPHAGFGKIVRSAFGHGMPTS